ncbi:hypothetical protein PoB_003736300 [Plakobranchus ocellatus]|uniref:Uncharacterized protein n=1 Tax=Plakobranchus ocellatus TaxID=259542 RepID=A0AAV4AWG4_9GAST|nr:hypothetical protein PoB_003736300 [Plakobranchus ocellatus]
MESLRRSITDKRNTLTKVEIVHLIEERIELEVACRDVCARPDAWRRRRILTIPGTHFAYEWTEEYSCKMLFLKTQGRSGKDPNPRPFDRGLVA